jgi:hypothetical protein
MHHCQYPFIIYYCKGLQLVLQWVKNTSSSSSLVPSCAFKDLNFWAYNFAQFQCKVSNESCQLCTKHMFSNSSCILECYLPKCIYKILGLHSLGYIMVISFDKVGKHHITLKPNLANFSIRSSYVVGSS